MLLLELFLTVMFGTASAFSVAVEALFIAGMWGIFRKCGVKPWRALVPALRYYDLACCAAREPEGRVIFVLEVLTTLLNLTGRLVGIDSRIGLICAAASLVVLVINVIYSLRVSLGLIEVFGVKKRWLILAVLGSAIFVLIFGWSKAFRPRWKVEDYRTQAAALSGASVKVMGEGLTVNLEERTVTEFFEKKYLLRDIHMYIRPGSLVLLLGGSGAGKTTFLNAVNGYEKARARVALNGRDVYGDYREMQYDIGFVPQQDLMRGSDTVMHTLHDAALLRLPMDTPPDKVQERIGEVMGVFGLEPVKDSLVDKLSGGQRKRLSVAMEFISDPYLFILDEPDSGLDGVMARELFQRLRGIADSGRIVIVITHTPDRVADLFDDVIVLAKDAGHTGRLAYCGSVDGARSFFGKERMEDIVRSVNRPEEGGEGRADEFIERYAREYAGKNAEVRHG